MLKSTFLGATLAACALGFLATPDAALAQASYPTRPIKLIVPFTAGGGVDTVARILGDELKSTLGQPLVINDGRPTPTRRTFPTCKNSGQQWSLLV
jgi:tripartite-type tricarboxylate transporter receptor subunit TctC